MEERIIHDNADPIDHTVLVQQPAAAAAYLGQSPYYSPMY
jgi:hypothetical protein